jgi:hypothetical protein
VPIAAVQRVPATFSGATSCAIDGTDGWATPTSGNLIVLTINCDQTVTTPSGYTLGPSVVDDNAVYLFWKVSNGTETTPTITPAGTTTGVMTACEYSGLTASPFDASNSSTITLSSGTTTTSTSVTTTATGDLVIAVAGLANYSTAVVAPVSPSWTNSFANQISSDVGAGTGNHAATFYAELVAGAAGAYSTSASWTNAMEMRQELVIAFLAAVTATDAGGRIQSGFHPGRGPTRARFYQTPKSYDVASGTTFTQNLAGSVTPTGGLAKAVTKPGLAGTVTPTGTLANQANKALAGSVTPTGVLTTIKVVLRSFAGSVTPTGALAKQVSKPLSGASTPTGTLTKQVAKALAGSVTPSGALAKLVAKALAGSVTPTGVLTTTRVVLRSFVGSVTPTGVLARQAQKALAGTSTPRGALTKAVTKTLAGSVTAAGALAKLIAKPFSGRSTPTGSLTAINQGATQNATSTDAVTAVYTSTDSATAGRTSTSSTTAGRTSTPDVSDG